MPELLDDPVINPRLDPVELDAVDVPGELLVVLDPHAEDALAPPPSNAALDVLGHGIWSGLNPGGLSSVAPSGIPLELEGEDESESVEPSGEVAPIPDVGLACALAAATLASHMIAAKVHLPCIEVSRVVSG
jgi:hypothetical protein